MKLIEIIIIINIIEKYLHIFLLFFNFYQEKDKIKFAKKFEK